MADILYCNLEIGFVFAKIFKGTVSRDWGLLFLGLMERKNPFNISAKGSVHYIKVLMTNFEVKVSQQYFIWPVLCIWGVYVPMTQTVQQNRLSALRQVLTKWSRELKWSSGKYWNNLQPCKVNSNGHGFMEYTHIVKHSI